MSQTIDDLNVALFFGNDIIAKAKERRLTPQQFQDALFMTACSVGAQMIDADGMALDGIKYTCNDGAGLLQLTIERVYADAMDTTASSGGIHPNHPTTH